MLLLSDLHLREDSQETVLDQVMPGIIAAAKQRNDFEIAILGDVFHFRYHVPVKLLNGFRDQLLMGIEEGVHWRILPGNHDQVDVAGRNALEVFGHIDGVRVYTQPAWDEWGLWFPYRKQELVADLLQSMGARRKLNQPSVLFIHHGIKGAWMNDGIQNSDGLPLSLFAGCQMVICGHWHRHQYVGQQIAYVGSPYQTKADESGQVKGYCTWDGQTLTHHPMEWGARYHRFQGSNGGVDLQAIRAGDDVRVNVSTRQEAEELGRVLAQMGVRHVITIDQEQLEARLDVQDGAALGAYARAYVEAASTDLDKSRLMTTFTEIIT